MNVLMKKLGTAPSVLKENTHVFLTDSEKNVD